MRIQRYIFPTKLVDFYETILKNLHEHLLIGLFIFKTNSRNDFRMHRVVVMIRACRYINPINHQEAPLEQFFLYG
jgi:hypothetical protein